MSLDDLLDEYRAAAIHADHCYGEGNEGELVSAEIGARQAIIAHVNEISITPDRARAFIHGEHHATSGEDCLACNCRRQLVKIAGLE